MLEIISFLCLVGICKIGQIMWRDYVAEEQRQRTEAEAKAYADYLFDRAMRSRLNMIEGRKEN